MSIRTLLLTLAIAGRLPAADPTTLAARPPMGWNSYNAFRNKIDDALIRTQVDALVSSGMKDAGYQYVNLDEGWAGSRDAAGLIHSNAGFPDMKALADSIHFKGLKFGLYSAPPRKPVEAAPAAWDTNRRTRKLTRSGASIT